MHDFVRPSGAAYSRLYVISEQCEHIALHMERVGRTFVNVGPAEVMALAETWEILVVVITAVEKRQWNRAVGFLRRGGVEVYCAMLPPLESPGSIPTPRTVMLLLC